MFRPKDPISAYTHLGAVIVAIIAAPYVIYRAAIHNELISALIYLVSLITLFSASTIYHTFKKVFLKKLDHCSIFLLIAGTYTPFCLISLRGKTGYILLAVIWGMAIAGTIFKLFFVFCPRYISSIIYIAMGWAVIFTMPELVNNISTLALILLAAGGVIYTIGGVIYALKPKIFKNEKKTGFGNHELFHLFVDAGALCHLLCIAFCII